MSLLGVEFRGAFAANLSRFFRIPIAATYEWSDEKKTAVVRGIVTDPVRPFFSSPKKITPATELVHVRNATCIEITQGVPRTENPGHSWAVHTSAVRIQIGQPTSRIQLRVGRA